MPSSRRIPLLIACVTGACLLGTPAALANAPADGQGVVLSAGGHAVRLVDAAHRVDRVRVRSTRGLRRGDVVRVRRGSAKVTGHRREVSFLGRVVRGSGRGAVVRLGDGSTFKLSGVRIPHGRRAPSPGQVLLITIATGKGSESAVTVKPVPAGTRIGGGGDRGKPGDGNDDGGGAEDSGDDPGAEDAWADEADGTVSALADDGSWLTIVVDDAGAEETYAVADPGLLDGIVVGDEVAVYLNEDGTAIDVELLDWSEADLDSGGDDDDGDDDA